MAQLQSRGGERASSTEEIEGDLRVIDFEGKILEKAGGKVELCPYCMVSPPEEIAEFEEGEVYGCKHCYTSNKEKANNQKL